MHRFARIFALLVSVTLVAGALSGCATVFWGTSESVSVDSIPPHADVFLNGDRVGRTPIELKLDRDTMPLLVLRKDGYDDTRLEIASRINPGIVTNLFPGGLLIVPIIFGPIVDVRSGAACAYAEDDLVVPLLMTGETKLELYDGNVRLTKYKN